jgi:hypothetical protein
MNLISAAPVMGLTTFILGAEAQKHNLYCTNEAQLRKFLQHKTNRVILLIVTERLTELSSVWLSSSSNFYLNRDEFFDFLNSSKQILYTTHYIRCGPEDGKEVASEPSTGKRNIVQ